MPVLARGCLSTISCAAPSRPAMPISPAHTTLWPPRLRNAAPIGASLSRRSLVFTVSAFCRSRRSTTISWWSRRVVSGRRSRPLSTCCGTTRPATASARLAWNRLPNSPYNVSMRVIGLAGWSGSGKTTLVTKVIPVLVKRGLKLATVKHAHHEFDTDQPGKDSWLHRRAGASEVAVVSSRRWAIVHELQREAEPSLDDMLEKLSPVDLVIVEGFKRHAHPKLEVYRAAVGKPLLHPDDDCIVAVATDAALPQAQVPVVMLDDIETIANVLQAEALLREQIAKDAAERAPRAVRRNDA